VYAIFEDGGKQYKVSQGDRLLIERRDLPEDASKLTFDSVLLVGEGPAARVGTPHVAGASVTADLVEELKTPKVVGIKFNRRKGYKKKFGHRQQMMLVQISGIHG
jgi:large subunit ribosomal protein L21